MNQPCSIEIKETSEKLTIYSEERKSVYKLQETRWNRATKPFACWRLRRQTYQRKSAKRSLIGLEGHFEWSDWLTIRRERTSKRLTGLFTKMWETSRNFEVCLDGLLS